MACCQIIAERRWCVTGTPIQNSIQDVYGYLKILKHEPWCESKFGNHAITSSNNNEPQQEITALFRIRRILSPLILRRTKDTTDANGYVQTYTYIVTPNAHIFWINFADSNVVLCLILVLF